jgi:hypothetical protein
MKAGNKKGSVAADKPVSKQSTRKTPDKTAAKDKSELVLPQFN